MKKWVGILTAFLLTLALSTSASADTVPIDHGAIRQNSVRYQGLVLDASNGTLISGVCVWAGPTACPEPALVTEGGYWAIDLPDGPSLTWDMHFGLSGYVQQDARMDYTNRFIIVTLHRIP